MPILFTDPLFTEHDTGQHPECAARLQAIHAHLAATGLNERFDHGDIQPATLDQLARVHPGTHIDTIRDFATDGGGRIESDTVVSPRSFDVALHAAGTAIAAVDAIVSGSHRQAVCLIRPPGHHALPSKAMGFCLFNNVAIAARHAQAEHGIERVLIVDWDVHHGNGTQDIFYDDSQVTFFSAHRHPFYPGTGLDNETGQRDGLGHTLNLPLAFGITRHEYHERFASMLQDAATRSQPDLILLSAGFDAHTADPVGSLGLESEDFTTLTELLVQVANTHCKGHLVSLLEGGYNVDALAESVGCHLEALVGRETT